MRTQTIGTIAVVGVLLLAGCSGITGSGDDGGGDYPAADSITNDQLDAHADALNGTSFTSTMTVNQSGETVSSAEYRIDPSDGQSLQRSTSQYGNSTLYTSGDSSYRQSRIGNETQAAPSERGVNATAATGRQVLKAYVSENISYERAGTETFDGDDVMRYEADGTDALSRELLNATAENVSLTEFSADLLVDSDGRVRQFRADITFDRDGETVNSVLELTVTDIGSTDVEEPAWVSQVNATPPS